MRRALLLAVLVVAAGCHTDGEARRVRDDFEAYRARALDAAGDRIAAAVSHDAGRPGPPAADALEGLGALVVDWSVPRALGTEASFEEVGLADVLRRALLHSPKLRVVATGPLIEETRIDEREGEYDWIAVAEARHDYTDRPTGSSLDTGSEERTVLRENRSQVEAGVTRKLHLGTEVSILQRLRQTRTNSELSSPNPQTLAVMSLEVRQPLLRGGGWAVYHSLIALERAGVDAAMADFLREATEHLLEVIEAYHGLYLARAELANSVVVLGQVAKIVEQFDQRTDEILPHQRARALADLARRQTLHERARRVVITAQLRLVALVGDPALKVGGRELVPAAPGLAPPDLPPLRDALLGALRRRPAIDVAFHELRKAAHRLALAENEALPSLEVIATASVEGLRETEGGAAVRDETSDSPTMGAAVRLEVPLGNRTARAKELRARLELRRLRDRIDELAEEIALEVRTAEQEVLAGHRQLCTSWQSWKAAKAEVDALEERRVLNAQRGTELSVELDALLNAYARHAAAQSDLTSSMVGYTVSRARYLRATGELLRDHGDRRVVRGADEQGEPVLQIELGAPGR